MVTSIPQLDLDFSDPLLVDDPFSVCEAIRAAGRVVWNGALRGWMIPGFDDCLEVLSDDGERFVSVGSRLPEVTFWFDASNMIVAEGPDHRRLRRGLARYFTTAAIERSWEPRVREVVEELLAPLAEGHTNIDLVADFTKIPAVIVGEMLGVPEERHEDLRRWSSAVVGNLSFGHETADERQVMDEAIAECSEYMGEEIERHRRDEPDDLLTVIVNMPDWTEDEIRSSAMNLVLAGYDLAAKLLGECLVALERHPDQRRVVAKEPALIPNAIEEVLRWHSPAQATVRLTARETTLAGTQLREGDVLYVLRIAANRDPARWPNPDRFDVRRPFQPHLGFGVGPHVCIAAPLARLVTAVALETLLRVAPEYQLRDIEYGRAFFTRGPEKGVIQILPS